MFKKLRPKNLWVEAITSSLALGVGIVIVSFFTKATTEQLVERFFFQTLAILTFVWIINRDKALYAKDDIKALEKQIAAQETPEVTLVKERTFNF